MDAQFVSSLEETLKQTLVPDSSVIKQASSKLTKDFYPNPIALPALLQISQTTKQDEIKQLSLVEARKLALDQWETVDASLKPTLRESLLKGTFEEQNKRLRNLSAYVIAAIGEVDLDKTNGKTFYLLYSVQFKTLTFTLEKLVLLFCSLCWNLK